MLSLGKAAAAAGPGEKIDTGGYMTRILVVEDEGKLARFLQLELEVATENMRGVALYKKFGFAVYGTRERGFFLRDGRFLDEYLMHRRL